MSALNTLGERHIVVTGNSDINGNKMKADELTKAVARDIFIRPTLHWNYIA